MYDEIAVHYLPWIGRPLNALPKQLAHLRTAIADADIVHCFGLYSFICPIAVREAAKARKPTVLEPMGMFVPQVRTIALKRLYNATATKWMAKRASAIIATAESEAVELEPLRRFAEVVVRRNGIDLEEFASLPDRSIMRKRWNATSNERLVIYIGRISEKKKLRELVEAFVRVNIPNTKLVIAGPISEPHYADQLGRDVHASPRRSDILIETALYDDDLKAALSAADLFMLPSLNENFGNAAGEAVAAGVPVLLTETCGIAPMIHGRAGMAVPLGVEHLARGIKLMLDPVIRDQFVVDREEVKRELSWEQPIAQQIALYERIVAESRS